MQIIWASKLYVKKFTWCDLLTVFGPRTRGRQPDKDEKIRNLWSESWLSRLFYCHTRLWLAWYRMLAISRIFSNEMDERFKLLCFFHPLNPEKALMWWKKFHGQINVHTDDFCIHNDREDGFDLTWSSWLKIFGFFVAIDCIYFGIFPIIDEFSLRWILYLDISNYLQLDLISS